MDNTYPTSPISEGMVPLAAKVELRVGQLALAVLLFQVSAFSAVLAAATAVTIVGAVLFGLAALGLWIWALVLTCVALAR